MSRVFVIGSDIPVGRKIGDALAAAHFPMEYASGDVDALQRLRIRSFGVVITSPDSAVEEDLALVQEVRFVRPGVKIIVLTSHSTPDEVIAVLRAQVLNCFTPPFIPDVFSLVMISSNAFLFVARRAARFVVTCWIAQIPGSKISKRSFFKPESASTTSAFRIAKSCT